jgi:prophage regulatory protein
MSEQARAGSKITPRLLKQQEAAAYCGVSTTVFTEACPVKPIMLLGRIRRWDRFALDAWIEKLAAIKNPEDELDPVKMWDDAKAREQSKSETSTGRKLLRQSGVTAKYPCGKTKLYELIKEGCFPAPIKLGRVSFWDEAEVDAAIERLVAASRTEGKE